MRNLSPNLVRVRFHSLVGLALLGCVAAGGCARFPAQGALGNFTRITFRFSVSGAINDSLDGTPLSQYVYIVAIRTLTTDDIPVTGSPLPVVGSPSSNGFVAGSPTHFVQYDSLRTSQPFVLNKFNPGPTPGDPSNPINLTSWFDTAPTRGRIVNFVRPIDPGGNPRTLQFDIFTNQLVDSDNLAANLRQLQVNILTMNRTANTGGGTRVWDALGNSLNPTELNTFITVDLRTNTVTDNRNGVEPQADTVGANDPDVDISDFTIEVQRP